MGKHHRIPLGWKPRLKAKWDWIFAVEGRPLQVLTGSLSVTLFLVLGVLWLAYG